jgi:hypothetical protein
LRDHDDNPTDWSLELPSLIGKHIIRIEYNAIFPQDRRSHPEVKTGPGFAMAVVDAIAATLLIGAGAGAGAVQAAETAKPAAFGGGGQASPQPSAAEIGKKLADPLSDVWALFTEFDYTINKGDLSGQDAKSGYNMIFQPIMPFKFGVEKSVVRQDDFGKDWTIKLNVIPVIPALVKNPLF